MRTHVHMKDSQKRNHLHKKPSVLHQQHTKCVAQHSSHQVGGRSTLNPSSPHKSEAEENVCRYPDLPNGHLSSERTDEPQQVAKPTNLVQNTVCVSMGNLNSRMENLSFRNGSSVGSCVQSKRKMCDFEQEENIVDQKPDDVTVGELASYFENFVYIPRKMSAMAEMMYT